MATNPAVSMPEADLVRDALRLCPFVVVSDVGRKTDTTAFAHVLLPSSGWGEKDGTVTNSERRVSRQRPFRAAPGEARPDWWQIAEVAKRMGFGDAFAWRSPSEIYAEYAALTGHANGGTRDLDLSAHRSITAGAYDALEPFQWPLPSPSRSQTSERLLTDGAFFTPDRRARFVATHARPPFTRPSPDRPFVLNTGRIRDQWHTMTRTSRAARLSSHAAEPFVEIHPADAAALGIAAADLARLDNCLGSAILRAAVTDRVSRGAIFAPMHWNDQFASNARIGALLAGNADDVSGQPELKHGAVKVERFDAAWFAFAAGISRPETTGADYWAVSRAESGWRIELASSGELGGELSLLSLLWPAYAQAEVLSYRDPVRGELRLAAYDGATLLAAVFIGPSPVACQRDHITMQLGKSTGTSLDRIRILAGRSATAAGADHGPILCACMGVGRNRVIAAIGGERSGSCTVDTIGAMTGAGTNCGSCRAEIRGLIHAASSAKAG
jgi:assimilatory nitrate reductase catalytic subunit